MPAARRLMLAPDKPRVSRLRPDLIELAAALEEIRTRLRFAVSSAWVRSMRWPRIPHRAYCPGTPGKPCKESVDVEVHEARGHGPRFTREIGRPVGRFAAPASLDARLRRGRGLP